MRFHRLLPNQEGDYSIPTERGSVQALGEPLGSLYDLANTAEVAALQDMISEWLQDPPNADNCASIDCMDFSHIVCEENTCIPIENE